MPVARPPKHLSPNEPPKSPDKPLSPNKQLSYSSFGAAKHMMDQQQREVFKPYTRHKSDAPTAEQADTMKGDALLPLHVSPTSVIDSRLAVLPKIDHCPPEGAIRADPFPGGCLQTDWAKVGNPLFVGCVVPTTQLSCNLMCLT